MVWEESKDILKKGDKVKLTKDIKVMAGTMKAGTIVTVIGCTQMRGYDFEDDEGHRVIECGFKGFEKINPTNEKKVTKMEKYEFGVMSSKWSLEANDPETAYVSMSIFIAKNISIAVYKPKRCGIMPEDILEKNKDSFDKEAVSKCINSIKTVALPNGEDGGKND